ncbi:MAG: hypothetical protein FGM15_02795 [Chthoniobacterales bacterium]|nr:hypothetical protein [Chthoniobacterales bacterium]
MKLPKVFLIAASLACLLALQGCSLVACGVGVGTMVNDMNVRHEEGYRAYVRREQSANLEREKSGLPPSRIMSFKQWKKEQ